MHDIEPYYNWRHLYTAEEDEHSPYFGTIHSEIEFSNTVYNYFIHPQWDEFGSKNLYLKIIFIDYEEHVAIIEFIGEWNDVIENDIMQLKRTIIDVLLAKKISKYILIVENVYSFFLDTNDYYQEWHEEINEQGGWIYFLNILPTYLHEFKMAKITPFVLFETIENWRTLTPDLLFQKCDTPV